MPKTPPLILPNNITSTWVNRSKVSKKKPNSSNIFAAQNKQITFDENDEYHFITPFSATGSSVTDNNDITSSIMAIDEMQTRTISTSVATQNPFVNASTQGYKQHQYQSQPQQQQQQQPQLQHRPEEPKQELHQEPSSSQKTPNPLAKQNNMPSSSSSKHNDENAGQCHKQAAALGDLGSVFDHKTNAKDFLTPSSQQFESLIIVSQDLATDFQKFMEEYRDIKKSIEEKKKELIQYTEERMLYLAQRQAHFQQQLKSLQEFI